MDQSHPSCNSEELHPGGFWPIKLQKTLGRIEDRWDIQVESFLYGRLFNFKSLCVLRLGTFA